MAEYHSVNVRLLDFQMDKLKSVTKNATPITIRLSSGMIGTDKTNFLPNLLLTDRQVVRL